MAIMELDGGRVWYEEAGTGEPPILLLHGIGQHGHFAGQVAHLARRHRVIVPDLPGFGRSDVPQHDCTVASLAADAAALCGRLGLDSPVIVGHSLAGAIALQLAATHPDLPAALVLLDPVGIAPLPAWPPAIAGLVAALRGPAHAAALQGYTDRMFRPSDDATLRARIVEDMVAARPEVVASLLASGASWDVGAVVGRVQAPVLLVSFGEGTPIDLERVREVIPQVEVGRAVGVGHFGHLIAPDQINAMIDRFLAVSGASVVAL
jgi:pimeloyl-ACP methyl ester carboxylesterase